MLSAPKPPSDCAYGCWTAKTHPRLTIGIYLHYTAYSFNTSPCLHDDDYTNDDRIMIIIYSVAFLFKISKLSKFKFACIQYDTII